MSFAVESPDLERLERWVKQQFAGEVKTYDLWSSFWHDVKKNIPHLPDNHIFFQGKRKRNLKTWAREQNPDMIIDERRKFNLSTYKRDSRFGKAGDATISNRISHKAPAYGYFTPKELAGKLGINANTMRREIRKLEREGVFVRKDGKYRVNWEAEE